MTELEKVYAMIEKAKKEGKEELLIDQNFLSTETVQKLQENYIVTFRPSHFSWRIRW